MNGWQRGRALVNKEKQIAYGKRYSSKKYGRLLLYKDLTFLVSLGLRMSMRNFCTC